MLHCPINDSHFTSGFVEDSYYSHGNFTENAYYPQESALLTAYEENFCQKKEPFFKKDYFGLEDSFGNYQSSSPVKVDDFETPDGLNGFGNVDLDKQEIFDYLRELKDQLQVCSHEKSYSLRQELFVSAVNALTHPQTDVVLIRMSQQCVQKCVDMAISDLDIDFLNVGIIFLLQISKPRTDSVCSDLKLNAADRKIHDVLKRHAERTSLFMQDFADESRAHNSSRQDALCLGAEFRRTFMDLVFQIRFDFLRKVRDSTPEQDTKIRSKFSGDAVKKNKQYQDRGLTCCPGNFVDPPKTPYFKPIGGFWLNSATHAQKRFE